MPPPPVLNQANTRDIGFVPPRDCCIQTRRVTQLLQHIPQISVDFISADKLCP